MKIKCPIILLLAAVFLSSVSACQARQVSHVVDSAKIVSYNSAEELSEDSALIADVRKTDEEPYSVALENGHGDPFTLSHVELTRIMKPMAEKELEVGESIKILESEWVDPEDKDIVHHREGYLKMQKGKSYTLYLGYNKMNDTFYPLGLLFGKIPHDISEEVVWEGSLPDEISKDHKEVRLASP